MVELPRGVHRVVSRGREYFYWHPGRGTKAAGQAVRLPQDPTSPEFWQAVRNHQGLAATVHVTTLRDVVDLWKSSPQFARLRPGTRTMYAKPLRIIVAGFGGEPAETIRPPIIRGVFDGLSETPGAANNFLGVMRALSSWGVARGHFPASLTEGVEPNPKTGGHKPWTDAQIAAATKSLTGMVRRGFLLARYTGQRGSDVVKLGETFVDEGGFRLTQTKTGREIWCPIDDELAREIATWGRRPGPYMRQADGRPYTRKRFDVHFDKQRDAIPELAGASLHGLRATRVIELRRFGLTTTQIQDQVGMSLEMIERYCRFADKKASGKAAVVSLSERRRRGGS